MAPVDQAATNQVETQLKDIVQNLYNLIVQSFDHQGNPTQDAMKREMQVLVQNLLNLTRTAPSVNIEIPPDVTSYVEGSRNPDVFTREFVETVQRMNQALKGRLEGYRLMQDSLAQAIIRGIPALSEDVVKVCNFTGHSVTMPSKQGAST
ncbi:mediator of RNA polymerase II transcription subunit 10 [Aaosphaeria arxii CBS 175.79]|uniref:Mediator of RNA polymerase II transcription subunit 10 n=1 Tax=Aaosphaeria arxii CBS 175.79 TaxID=1450172 RepID=A0A6A5X8V0_9PLEO|nr:mediator of RNA polymerase II transcription subunit 10 [Aaosphaeria arxii CBS 175.79]KAF2009184.1 mediator of RNA polymerase II transcription subunit 10 [Aaosphaeria arxii CBS 175.79]